MKHRLIECELDDPSKFSPETIILIGNGAIENGNLPLKEAIKSDYQNLFPWEKEYKISNPDLATILANYAFAARSNRHALLEFIQSEKFEDNFRQIIDAHFYLFNEFRKGISEQFELAVKDKTIRLRDFPASTHIKEPFGVISLNWDELLHKSSYFSKNMICLHGRTSIQESLILPAEGSIDDFFLDIFLKQRSLDKESLEMKSIEKGFRPKLVREEHDSAHRIAQTWFDGAKRIIVWGVAFNAYDAELMSIIPKPDTDKRSLVIINPDPRARDIAGTLIGNNPRLRMDYDPLRLEWIKKDWANLVTKKT